MSDPTISVVIPTLGRSTLQRAVAAVHAQTYPVREILVMVDTDQIVTLPDMDRVRIVQIGPGAGANIGRQRGIELAEGRLVALLDDDDVWEPEKLAEQIAVVGTDAVSGDRWIATTAMLYEDDRGQRVVPQRRIDPDESVAEYLYRRRGVRRGGSGLQTSTLLFPRELALRVPFRAGLSNHQEVTWLLDVSAATPDLRVLQVMKRLSTYRPNPSGISSSVTAREQWSWGLQHLQASDPRTRGDYFLTVAIGRARVAGQIGDMARSIWTGLRHGRPGPAALFIAAADIPLCLGYRVARALAGRWHRSPRPARAADRAPDPRTPGPSGGHLSDDTPDPVR